MRSLVSISLVSKVPNVTKKQKYVIVNTERYGGRLIEPTAFLYK